MTEGHTCKGREHEIKDAVHAGEENYQFEAIQVERLLTKTYRG